MRLPDITFAFFVFFTAPLHLVQGQRCAHTGELPIAGKPAPQGMTDRNLSYNIPVVFNILYENDSQNISDNQVVSQLNILNEDYNLQNTEIGQLMPEWASIAGTAGFHFYLYNSTQSHQGIRRKKMNREAFGAQFSYCYPQFGGLEPLEPEKVLNIWIMPLDRPTLGFANPPHQYPPAERGVVADYRCVGGLGAALLNPPFHLGRTLTHEIGHYFGLLHPWGNFTGECAEDDGITDTPAQDIAVYGCPNETPGCTGPANASNFMNLADDACMAMFTQGQAAAMRAFIDTYLPQIPANTSDAPPLPEYTFAGNADFNLYPNPSNGHFAIQTPADLIERLEIRDLSGRLVLEKNGDAALELLHLPASVHTDIYLVILTTSRGRYCRRLVIAP